MVQESPPLEPMNCYTYLLLCSHFSQTSIIAKDDHGVIGFIGGYRPPTHPDAVFVWQIGVHPRGQGHGLGGRMLDVLWENVAPQGVRYLEATVAPSNTASQRLFTSFAKRHGAECAVTSHFEVEHFEARHGGINTSGGETHEAEELFRIGPVQS